MGCGASSRSSRPLEDPLQCYAYQSEGEGRDGGGSVEPTSFTVDLSRQGLADGGPEDLGALLAQTDGFLYVKELHAHGLLPEWNMAQALEEGHWNLSSGAVPDIVQVGDIVVSANGQDDAMLILRECSQARALHLRILPRGRLEETRRRERAAAGTRKKKGMWQTVKEQASSFQFFPDDDGVSSPRVEHRMMGF